MKFLPGSKLLRTVALSLTVLAIGVVPAWSTGAGALTRAHPILPPHEPSRNFRLTDVNKVLASINAARFAQEGLAPLSFDAARFAKLSVSRQVFVVSNLERTTRGLYPAMAMLTRLDTIAANAARSDQDPTDSGKGFSSIWSSAPSSLGQYAFFADFGWMYDDGPPPQYIFRNVDCAMAGQSGCWGHRDNILSNPLNGWKGCRGELVTGTGFAMRTPDGPSLAQIFEVACSNLATTASYTWRDAVIYLHIPASQSGLG
jgi:hypothetical protein